MRNVLHAQSSELPMRTWKGQAAVIRVCSFCVLQGLRQLIPLQRVFREKHQTWGSAARTTRVARLGQVVAVHFHHQC